MSLRSLAHIGVSAVVLSTSTTDSLFVSQSLAQCELSLLTLISPRSACTRLPEVWYIAIEVADFVAEEVFLGLSSPLHFLPNLSAFVLVSIP